MAAAAKDASRLQAVSKVLKSCGGDAALAEACADGDLEGIRELLGPPHVVSGAAVGGVSIAAQERELPACEASASATQCAGRQGAQTWLVEVCR